MSRPRYDWKNGLPCLESHSRCKHEIIRDYLIQYMCVVSRGFLRFPNKTFNFTIVDGFAGGGKYLYNNSEVDGSPLVILKAAQEAAMRIKLERDKLGRDSINVNTDFIFVEKDKNVANFLRNTLQNEWHSNEKVSVKHGEFGTHLPEIIQFVQDKSRGKAGRAIFILDQYGFGQVLLSQLREIMESLQAEVILTFAVDALVAYLRNKKTTMEKIGLTESEIQQIWQAKTSDECRGLIQHILSRHFSGMDIFYTPFCIHGDTSHWGYWVVHLSAHYKARDEMLKIHWDKGTQLVHYGGAGIDMFGYRSQQDEKHTGQVVLADEFRFDNFAENRVINALRKEIPILIREKREIKYCDLLNETFNHTPAKREIIEKVLWEMVESREVSIPRRDVKNIKDNDVIKTSPQRTFNFWKNRE